MGSGSGRKPFNSMTGFGDSKVSGKSGTFIINASSTNHKFLDIQLKLPDELSALEPRVRNHVRSKASRGRILVAVNRSACAGGRKIINSAIAKMYRDELEQLSGKLKITGNIDLGLLVSLPGVILDETLIADVEGAWKVLKKGLEEAVEKMSRMRRKEGETIRKDMKKSLSLIRQKTGIIRRRAKTLPRKKSLELNRRIKETGFEPDKETLAREIAGIISRADINEELLRLKSHIGQFEDSLAAAPSGPKLDFILQELLREINTIASKGQDSMIAKKVIDIKAELQRMREQVQNVE